MFIQKYTIFNKGVENLEHPSYYIYLNNGNITWVFANINFTYINYYIQEIEKLISGERQNDLTIHVTDDEELMPNLPDDWVIVNKNEVFCPPDRVDQNFPNHNLPTSDLLDLLKFIKKDQNLDDTIEVDERDGIIYEPPKKSSNFFKALLMGDD
jgi:hypothetical protein